MERRKLVMNKSEGHLGGYIYGGDPLTFFGSLWEWIIDKLEIKSVLDIGCGEGHSTKYFKERGCEVLGIDGSPQAIKDNQLREEVVLHDYCDGPYKPKKKYDIVWSCEFVEHVEEKYLDNFLQTFACANKYIFMTFAGPGQPGHHHVNCQPKEYWINKMSRIGFRYDSHLTTITKDISSPGHFKRRGLVFVKKTYRIPIHIKLRISCCNPNNKLFRVIDKFIGRIGIVIKKHTPQLYRYLKKK